MIATCPADCSGKHKKQDALLPGQLARIRAEDRDMIRKATLSAKICPYCGCVYAPSTPPVIFGWLDAMGTIGWESAAATD